MLLKNVQDWYWLYLPDFSYSVATLVLTIATVSAAATATAKDRMWGKIYCNNWSHGRVFTSLTSLMDSVVSWIFSRIGRGSILASHFAIFESKQIFADTTTPPASSHCTDCVTLLSLLHLGVEIVCRWKHFKFVLIGRWWVKDTFFMLSNNLLAFFDRRLDAWNIIILPKQFWNLCK